MWIGKNYVECLKMYIIILIIIINEIWCKWCSIVKCKNKVMFIIIY